MLRLTMTQERVGAALRIVADGLRPFIEQQMRRVHGDYWERVARSSLQTTPSGTNLDLAALLSVMHSNWASVFRSSLSHVDRAYASELRDVRNRWAHQELFSAGDVERTLDTARRLLRSISAETQLAELDQLAGVVRPGVVRLPPAAKPISPLRPVSSSSKVRSADWSAPVEDLIAAFGDVFACAGRRFGSTSLGHVGVCDGVEGVQWSVAMSLRTGEAWMSVNLEGMQYDGWPIARLIEREEQHSEFPQVISGMPDARGVILQLWRDCWQASSRVRIVEGEIAPTPITLDALTNDGWRAALAGARECLDAERGFRGRRRRDVTLAASGKTVEREVSPHLNVRLDLRRPSVASSWREAIVAARDALVPLHAFVVRRSGA